MILYMKISNTTTCSGEPGANQSTKKLIIINVIVFHFIGLKFYYLVVVKFMSWLCLHVIMSNTVLNHIGTKSKDDLKDNVDFSSSLNLFCLAKIWLSLQVFGFTLEEEDMEQINRLHNNQKLIHLSYPIWKG